MSGVGRSGDFVWGAEASRRWARAASEPWFLLSNALFFLAFTPILITAQVRRPLLAERVRVEVERTGGPIIYMGWHAYSWASYLVFRGLPPPLRPTSVAHDGASSRFNSRCGAWLGIDTLVYRRHSRTSPAQQIIDYARRFRRHLVLFPDSGGPYRVVKPGIATVARALDARVVPFAIRSSRTLRIGSHMGHLLPLPTSRLELVCGESLAAGEVDPHTCSRALGALETLAASGEASR